MACNPNGQQERRENQFNKICLLDSLSKELAKLSNRQLEINFNPVGEFSELIDMNSAHASLQGMMEKAEKCFAEVVEELLNQGISVNTLEGIIRERGLEFDLDPNSTLEEAYNYINSIVLDGMPCDETKIVTLNSVMEFKWELVNDFHSKYWKEPDNYWKLHTIFVKAILGNADIKYTNIDNKHFSLSK